MCCHTNGGASLSASRLRKQRPHFPLLQLVNIPHSRHRRYRLRRAQSRPPCTGHIAVKTHFRGRFYYFYTRAKSFPRSSERKTRGKKRRARRKKKEEGKANFEQHDKMIAVVNDVRTAYLLLANYTLT